MVVKLAPPEIRTAAEGVYASRLRFIDTASQVGWDLNELPPSAMVMSQEVGAVLDEFFGFVAASCP